MNTERNIRRALVTRDLLTRGSATTEYEAARSGAFWSILVMLLGMLGTYGGTVISALGGDTTLGVAASALIALAGLCATVLQKLGYIRARAEIKTAVAAAVAADAQAALEEQPAQITPAVPDDPASTGIRA